MFTYSGNPGTSSRDLIRFLLGDVVESYGIFQDEEIDAILVLYPRPYVATIVLIDAAIARYSFTPDRVIDGLSIKWSSIIENLKVLRANLKDKVDEGAFSDVTGGAIYAGGLTYAEQALDEADGWYKQSVFRRDMFSNRENPG